MPVGRVLEVTDGDTVIVARAVGRAGPEARHIRLFVIDALGLGWPSTLS
jgi:hypothetical protein